MPKSCNMSIALTRCQVKELTNKAKLVTPRVVFEYTRDKVHAKVSSLDASWPASRSWRDMLTICRKSKGNTSRQLLRLVMPAVAVRLRGGVFHVVLIAGSGGSRSGPSKSR